MLFRSILFPKSLPLALRHGRSWMQISRRHARSMIRKRAMRNDGSNSQASGRIVLAATILGSSMAFIDGTVVNVALPALQNALHASIADVQWVVEAYALMLAALLLVGGSLGDIFGRRKVYVFGVVIFAAASAWCG